MENLGTYQQVYILSSTDGVQEGAIAYKVRQLGVWKATYDLPSAAGSFISGFQVHPRPLKEQHWYSAGNLDH